MQQSGMRRRGPNSSCAGFHGIDVEVRVDPRPVEVLLGIGAAAGTVLCLATHDRPDGPAKALHAVGSLVLERTERPVVVVGPWASVESLGTDVVVPVDGVSDPDSWPSRPPGPHSSGAVSGSSRCTSRFCPTSTIPITTPGFTVRPANRTTTWNRSASSWREFPFAVDAVAIADPVGVAAGLEQHLTDVPARLPVLGGRRPGPPNRPAASRGTCSGTSPCPSSSST